MTSEKRPAGVVPPGRIAGGKRPSNSVDVARALFEATTERAFLLDRRGAFLALNRSAATMFGSTMDDLLGKSMPSLLPPRQAAAMRTALDRVFLSRTATTHERQIQDSILITSLFPLLNKNSEVEAVACLAKGDDQPEEFEKALVLSEARFRTTYERSPVMMHSINRLGVLVNVNRKWREVLGYSIEEAVGRRINMFMTPESAQRAMEEILPKYWITGRISDVPYQYVKKDGTVIDVLLDSTVMNDPHWGSMSLSVIRDVTDQKRAEQELRRSEERFRAVFDGVRDCVFIKDRSLRFSHVNPAMSKLLGRPVRELLGLTATDVFGPGAAREIKEVEQRALQGQSIEQEHTRIVNGVKLTFHDILAPLRSDSGEIIGICGISRNITERKRIESESQAPAFEYPSAVMRETLVQARFAAAKDTTVLLLGESGTGKDFLARWIHGHSRRCNGPFFAVNCAAVHYELAESELFGHEAGAFTGARGRKRGLLELAEGGTLLLNEIGELSLALQSKLLAFLDTKSFLRVGGEKNIHVNARLIAATHRDLRDEVAKGRFLEPLFYRLNVFAIELPPLRRRLEDLPVLVRQILDRLAAEMQLSEIPSFDSKEIQALAGYDWPGNVRELRNVIERSLMLSEEGTLRLALPGTSGEKADWSITIRFPEHRSLHDVTDDVITALCAEALRRAGGGKNRAARMLGISRDSFYRYMKKTDTTDG